LSYVPHTDADRAHMLRAIGVGSLDELFQDVPEEIRLTRDLALPQALDEHRLLRHVLDLAGRNADLDAHVSFLGAGIYDHFVPSVVDALASRGEFATAYTPYQPELSQGMLQAIYEYQTLVCLLTGMEMANASMYDAATAIAEGALMAIELTGRTTVGVARSVNPLYRRVLRTYLDASGFQVRELSDEGGTLSANGLDREIDDTLGAVIVQSPNFYGNIEDLAAVQERAAHVGAKTVVAVDPISLGLLKPPGEYGADIVVGEGQALGSPMGFGGPLLGFFACKLEYQRRFPGRIVGATKDQQGRRGFTMTLRTREQDIRRERATSNICTNEALVALAATVYLCAMGPQGLREVADLCLQRSHYALDALTQIPGVEASFSAPFFKEFAVRLPAAKPVSEVNTRLLHEYGIVGGLELGRYYPERANDMLLCVTETRTREDIDRLVDAVRECVAR
jgi:glycine dehydrogenase subunit 1